MGILDKVLGTLVGNKGDKELKTMSPIVEAINNHFEGYKALTNQQLREKTTTLKDQIAQATKATNEKIEQLQTQIKESDTEEKEKLYEEIDQLKKQATKELDDELDKILPEAFAVVKETARRFKENETIEVEASDWDKELAAQKNHITIKNDKAIWKNAWSAAGNIIQWDMVHYDVQLIGGIALHRGKIAEMATGEGKTLVATLPVYLNALAGRGVHLVTVNDYLARRDAEWMGPIFEFHGLTIDCIDKHQPSSKERRTAYKADITYGTNNEFGFDYLRDNMCRTPEELVQRGHHYAIVDEVDSVLIDDARTPLIISGPTSKEEKQEFGELKPRVEKLMSAQRQIFNTQLADAKKLLNKEEPTKEEQKKGAEYLLRCYRGLPKNKALIKFLSEPGIKSILQKTENFYMQDQSKEMHKIDDDLFFVINEKTNSVDITDRGVDLITSASEDSNFFIIPDIGTELTQIEQSGKPKKEIANLKDNLLRDFSQKSERIHTIIQLLKAYSMFEKDVEYVLIDSKVKIVDEQTGRIMEGRRYSDGLHQAIEAKENVKVEAASQTHATVTLQNYFRMYHKLAGMTGTAETESKEFWDIYKLDVMVIPTNKPIVRKDDNDLVYKTKREKYNAVAEEIQQCVDAGRPVLVGTTSVEISELLSRMLKRKNIKHQVLNAKMHQREAEVVAEAGKAGTVTIATNMAGRGTDIKLGEGVKKAGGLAIIGTERHDSRRVDRQLRGRSGRQGDPGSSKFYVSLEDDLMRMFGSGRIAGLMDRMGLKEGEVITHSMITRSIERAQKKVEENNFGIRKRLLEYDDVNNNQREAIYAKRRHALFGERLSLDISNTLEEIASSLTAQYLDERDFQNFELDLLRYFSIESPVSEAEFIKMSEQELTETLHKKITEIYIERQAQTANIAFPVLKKVYEESGERFENILVPFTDGTLGMQVAANLKEAYETEGKSLGTSLEKAVSLAFIDAAWKDHLREMDELKQSVQHAVYEQKDPLLIYKLESFNLFSTLSEKINQDISSFLLKARIPAENPNVQQQQRSKTDMSRMKAGRDSAPIAGADSNRENPNNPNMQSQNAPTKQETVVRQEEKVGRNAPCPCGSGKKYKNCHGKVVA